MVTMRTDIDQIPLDGRHVLIGTITGYVMISRLTPKGRWVGMNPGDWPIAWLEIPEHPYFPTGVKPLLSGEVAKS